jgi:hypothetical protein
MTDGPPEPPSASDPAGAAERRAALRFGWTSLLAWAALGAALELAHGFKVRAYLDDELTRLLLRLAHAHGVGLSLVVLAYAGTLGALGEHVPRAAGRLLRAGALLVPLGFGASAFGHPEGDPSIAIALVPLGAAALLVGLALVTRAAWRAR